MIGGPSTGLSFCSHPVDAIDNRPGGIRSAL